MDEKTQALVQGVVTQIALLGLSLGVLLYLLSYAEGECPPKQ